MPAAAMKERIMGEFFTDLLRFPFLQYAVLAAVLSSVSCGIIGSFVTARRISYIAGAISHSLLAGMGAARYLNVVAGDFLAHAHARSRRRRGDRGAHYRSGFTLRQRTEDTVLGAIWAVGMAIGLLFIFATPGYSVDMMSYLFGNILMIRPTDLILMGVLDIVILAVTMLFYHKLLAVSFDEEFARIRGVQPERYFILLLILTALTIVVLVQVVGIIMVIALLTLPAAGASRLTRNLWKTMIGAAVLTFLYTAGGLFVSYTPNLPAGATIVVLAGTGYFLIILWSSVGRRIRIRQFEAAR